MRDHPAVVVALLSGAVLAARLLSIARFDVNTAATVLQVTGVGTAVAGTALTLLPLALVLLTCGLGLLTLVDPQLLDVPRPWAWFLFCLCAAGLLFLVAVPLLVLTVAAVLGMAALGRHLRRGDEPRTVSGVVAGSRVLRAQATVLAVVVVMAPIVLQRPWLPVQSVELADGDVVVGYLLGESVGRLAVMRDVDRTVVLVDPSDVEQRFICSGPTAVGGALGRLPRLDLGGSLAGGLLWGDRAPAYPACPAERWSSNEPAG